MKTKLSLFFLVFPTLRTGSSLRLTFFFFLLSLIFHLSEAQVPQGFNYQAIARDGSGNPLVSTSLPTRITIQADSLGTSVIWQEVHSSVTSNSFGLINLVLGRGTRQASSTVASFSAIDWSVTPKFIKTEIFYGGSYKTMGVSRLWSVPYALTAQNLAGTGKLGIKGTTTSLEEAIFEVKNKDGQTIFAVYNEGVRIYVDDGAKGTKGGFAVGGFGTDKAPSQKYLFVTDTSTRVYVRQPAKGTKGGFAVGGFDNTKADLGNYLNLTPQNYFIGHRAGSSNTTGKYNSYLGYESGLYNTTGGRNVFLGYHSGFRNDTASFNVFIGNNAGFSNKWGHYNVYIGFESGYTPTSAGYNTFVGYQTGRSNTTGDGNLFMGYTAGYNNTWGYRNVFLGYNSGKYNISGYENTFVGGHSGYGFNTGNANVMVGTYAGNYFYGGNNNIFIGNESGFGVKNSTTTANNNIFIGTGAGRTITTGQENTFIGTGAGYHITTGYNNVFIGNLAANTNTQGHDNLAFGNSAGYKNNVGNYNVFIGTESGNNSDANYNTFMGYMSGASTTTGGFNTMVGYTSGYANVSGVNNAYFGYAAGSSCTGTYNTYIGAEAGYFASTGSNNVYVGIGSGRVGTGSDNVFIGKFSGYGETGSNKLVIENNFTGDDNENNALIYGEFDNNKLRFNSNVGINTDPGVIRLYSVDITVTNDNPALIGQHNVTAYYGIGVRGIGGYVGVKGESTLAGINSRIGIWGDASGGATNYGVYGTASGGTAYAGYFAGNVTVTGTFSNPSDKNLKKNIMPLGGSLNKVLSLQGVRYEWKSEAEIENEGLLKNSGEKEAELKKYNFPAGQQIGVIAQEVEKVLPELVHTDAEGLKSVDYIKIIPLLIEAIKEQQHQIDELKKLIPEMK